MKLVIGLGNPEKKYQATRHNIGFMVVDAVAQALGVEFKSSKKLKSEITKTATWLLIKPQTYMNLSGEAVQAVASYYNVNLNHNLVLVHDDLDLKLGAIKYVFGKGPKDHHGVMSVEQHLGTDQFWRLRIGIDNRPDGWKQTGADYVLSPFNQEERKILETAIKQAVQTILSS